MEQKQLVINGKSFFYAGIPLMVLGFTGESWGGNSNFLVVPEKQKTRIDLKDLNYCFHHIRETIESKLFIYGFVLDYSTKTIYYDKQSALEHAHHTCKLLGQEGYFENFIQKDFLSA